MNEEKNVDVLLDELIQITSLVTAGLITQEYYENRKNELYKKLEESQ